MNNPIDSLVMRLPDGWHIEHNPKPIPDRSFDFDFWHDDYDYCSETGSNGLSGTASSYEDAIRQIGEIDVHRFSALNEEGYKRFSA